MLGERVQTRQTFFGALAQLVKLRERNELLLDVLGRRHRGARVLARFAGRVADLAVILCQRRGRRADLIELALHRAGLCCGLLDLAFGFAQNNGLTIDTTSAGGPYIADYTTTSLQVPVGGSAWTRFTMLAAGNPSSGNPEQGALFLTTNNNGVSLPDQALLF